mmetsp:Transcript_20338/g.36330  ORF Transcript_20338/g.36330 Transcript_20338/m.36330 type:complete len:454 (+) Transcript_20338:67-1428(+)
MSASVASRRGRTGRVGRRSTSDDLEEVATQVAQASLDSENGEESPMAGQVAMNSQLKNMATPDLKLTAASNAIFQLPTPGRSGRNPPPPPPSEPPTPTANMNGSLVGLSTMPPPPAAPPASPPTAPPSMPPAVCGAQAPPAVPGAPHVAAPRNAPTVPDAPHAQGASKGNYREWLQARGQQAMSRSLNQTPGPLGTQSPTASPCPASPLATTIASTNYPGMSHPLPCSTPLPPMPSMRMSQPLPQTAPVQPSPQQAPPSQNWGVPCAEMQQPWYPQPEMPPQQNQGPPMIPGLCPRGGVMDCAGQQSPMSGDYQMMGCSPQVMGECNMQSPASAFMAGQQSPFGGQMSPYNQQVLPQDFSMGQLPVNGWPEDPVQMQQMPQPDPMQMVNTQMPPQQAISPSSCQPQLPPFPGRDMSHEEMMATVIPAAAYGLDREQLAHQLRAAAQCIDSYED